MLLKHLAAMTFALLLPLVVACAPETSSPYQMAAQTSPFSGQETNLSPAQLELLVGRIALYPDDLLAIVLPASTQPLQVADAQRFLAQRKADAGAQLPKTWDPSVVALLNYPEALALMNVDPTWLRQLGTSVVSQQPAVMDAIQSFRRKALAAGNLKSNERQIVSTRAGGPGTADTIVIESANPETLYVPVYEPTAAVQAGVPYSYYRGPYPYYYDPTAPFFLGGFFGASIGYGCDWDDHDIYRGDINVDREKLKQGLEERRQSALADQIRRNPENVWRADKSGLERARAADLTRSALQPSAAGSRDFGAGAADGMRSPGAFSGIDRGAAASRFSARGAGSLGGGARGGGGFRGGGRGGRR